MKENMGLIVLLNPNVVLLEHLLSVDQFLAESATPANHGEQLTEHTQKIVC
jgi:hypothetical protein